MFTKTLIVYEILTYVSRWNKYGSPGNSLLIPHVDASDDDGSFRFIVGNPPAQCSQYYFILLFFSRRGDRLVSGKGANETVRASQRRVGSLSTHPTRFETVKNIIIYLLTHRCRIVPTNKFRRLAKRVWPAAVYARFRTSGTTESQSVGGDGGWRAKYLTAATVQMVDDLHVSCSMTSVMYTHWSPPPRIPLEF